MPEDKRPCSGNCAFRPALRLHGTPSTPWLWGAPNFPGESRNRAEIPPAPLPLSVRLCYTVQPLSKKTPKNLAGARLLLCLGVGSLSPAGLGRFVVFSLFQDSTIGQGAHKMTWGMPYMNTLVPSVKVHAQPSLARQSPAPTTALPCQFAVPEGGGRNKIIQDHLFHANLGRITSLSWAEQTCGVKCIVETDLH